MQQQAHAARAFSSAQKPEVDRASRYGSAVPVAMFRELIARSQEQMTSRLAEARAKFEHRGDRGTAGAEVPFRELLADYLPRGLAVGQGEIIDTSDRRRSAQPSARASARLPQPC